MKYFFSSTQGIILVGVTIGILAVTLQALGNPANMGICVACFERDFVGALGLHRATMTQYLRPEIIGLLLGAFIGSWLGGEQRSRSGSSPAVRFFLGFFAMVGALVFLGCPWRTLLRLAGGDGNALIGLLGLIAGIFLGLLFIKRGFSLGRSYEASHYSGWIMPVVMLGCLALLVFKVKFGETGVLFFSNEGPGSKHAPLPASLGFALVVGFLAQRSRFCTVGAFRDSILIGDYHMLVGVASMVGAALLTNLALGQWNPGFIGQPMAHTDALWNFGGMALAGFAFALAGGCPGRQLVLAGEGDGDAVMFVMGMFAGGGLAHNFNMASSPVGVTLEGQLGVVSGLLFCLVIAFTMRIKMPKTR